MIWLSSLDLEWDSDLGRVVRARPGGIEDWLLARKLGIVLCALGGLIAVILALVIAPFSDTHFTYAYGLLAMAAVTFALIVAGRVGTVMRFETGPRFLDVPRLSRALCLASSLVFPCVLLQIIYPLKIVISHREIKDVKSVQEVVSLYNELDRGSRISFPTVKSSDISSVDPQEAETIRQSQILRARALKDQANAVYDSIRNLLSRYPDLGSEADFHTEQGNVNEIIQARLGTLAGMTGESVSQDFKSERTNAKEYVVRLRATELACGDPSRLLGMDPSVSLGCQLLYRVDMLSRLRERSFGAALFDSSEARRASDQPFGSWFGVSLYVLLFGWQGVFPVLVIAAIFSILVRIWRLSDIGTPYVRAAIGIIGIVGWVSLSPTKTAPTSLIGLPDLPVGLLLLPAWLLTMIITVRLCMLAAPAIPLLLLIGWEPPASLVWIIWLLAVMAFVGLGAVVPWLDRRMLEENCKPRGA
jgi:hypothetical protein